MHSWHESLNRTIHLTWPLIVSLSNEDVLSVFLPASRMKL